MICKVCNKDVPEQKFCINCGALLIDPNTVFRGVRFDSIEDCNKAKQNFELFSKKYLDNFENLTLDNVNAALTACEKDNITTALGSQVFIQFLHTKKEELESIQKKQEESALRKRVCNTHSKAIRAVNIIYAIIMSYIFFGEEVFHFNGINVNLFNMFQLVWPGSLGVLNWLFNAISLLVFIISIAMMINACINYNPALDSDNYAAHTVAHKTTVYFIIISFGIPIGNFLGTDMGVNNSYLDLIFVSIIAGCLTRQIRKQGLKQLDMTKEKQTQQ